MALIDAINVEKGTERRFARFFLIPLDARTGERLDPKTDLPSMRLQYWPETLNYSRGGIGWQKKDIPGSSHGLLSWSQNSNPTLSFEVVFTAETDPGYDPSTAGGLVDKLSQVGGGDAIFDKNRDTNESVNIDAGINWFAAACAPKYPDQQSRFGPASKPVEPPPIIQVVPEFRPAENLSENINSQVFGQESTGLNSFQKAFGLESVRGVHLSQQANRDFYGVLNEFSVTYQQFFPSGAPRIATVSCSFMETIQLGDWIRPHDRRQSAQVARKYRFSFNKKGQFLEES